MENIFEKQGIQFKIITEDMGLSVCDFMWENFFPDEPISRSLKLERHWITDELHLKDAIKDGSSIAAIDKNGSIIGVRLGKRKNRSQWMLKIFERTFMSLPYGLFEILISSKAAIFLKLINLVGYDVWKMFDQLGCDQIYEDAALCSARGSGVKGLGTELCRRTEVLAKELGCTHTYAAVTGTNIVIQMTICYCFFQENILEEYLKSLDTL